VRCCLCTVLFFGAALTGVQAASASLSEFPFEFREGLLWIKVSVPQSKAPLNFLVDTGAGVSVINLSKAKRIGLKFGRKVMVQGVETVLTGYWQERMSAKVVDVELPREYLSVDLDKLSSSCERPVDGLVGADFFRGRVVQIDFDAHKIRLLKPDKNRRSDEALPLQLRPCGMRVPISVDGHKRQWVRLDTGCATAFQWVTSLGLLAVRKLVILHTARIYLRDFSCCGVSKDVNKRRNQPPTKRRNLANEPWRFQQVQIAPLK